jgi:hypothetical protein
MKAQNCNSIRVSRNIVEWTLTPEHDGDPELTIKISGGEKPYNFRVPNMSKGNIKYDFDMSRSYDIKLLSGSETLACCTVGLQTKMNVPV